MVGVIPTGRVTGRRQLHFSGLQEILADVERLAQGKEIRTLGNWSADQVLKHLAIVMEKSIDGFIFYQPAVVPPCGDAFEFSRADRLSSA